MCTVSFISPLTRHWVIYERFIMWCKCHGNYFYPSWCELTILPQKWLRKFGSSACTLTEKRLSFCFLWFSSKTERKVHAWSRVLPLLGLRWHCNSWYLHVASPTPPLPLTLHRRTWGRLVIVTQIKRWQHSLILKRGYFCGFALRCLKTWLSA